MPVWNCPRNVGNFTIRLKRSASQRRPMTADGRSATVESERGRFDRRRSQFDPLLPVALLGSRCSAALPNRRVRPLKQDVGNGVNLNCAQRRLTDLASKDDKVFNPLGIGLLATDAVGLDPDSVTYPTRQKNRRRNAPSNNHGFSAPESRIIAMISRDFASASHRWIGRSRLNSQAKAPHSFPACSPHTSR